MIKSFTPTAQESRSFLFLAHEQPHTVGKSSPVIGYPLRNFVLRIGVNSLIAGLILYRPQKQAPPASAGNTDERLTTVAPKETTMANPNLPHRPLYEQIAPLISQHNTTHQIDQARSQATIRAISSTLDLLETLSAQLIECAPNAEAEQQARLFGADVRYMRLRLAGVGEAT